MALPWLLRDKQGTGIFHGVLAKETFKPSAMRNTPPKCIRTTNIAARMEPSSLVSLLVVYLVL